MSSDDNPFITAHKPVEDGFPFEVETDSLADSMGLRMPNRSLYLLQGKVGSGKSLIAQRLIHGMVHNGVKVLVITTELTTRLGRTDGEHRLRHDRSHAQGPSDGDEQVRYHCGFTSRRDPSRGAQQPCHPRSRRHRPRFSQFVDARKGYQGRPFCLDSTTSKSRRRWALVHALCRP